jgi:hypothetical protein
VTADKENAQSGTDHTLQTNTVFPTAGVSPTSYAKIPNSGLEDLENASGRQV